MKKALIIGVMLVVVSLLGAICFFHLRQRELYDLKNALPDRAAHVITEYSQTDGLPGAFKRGMTKDELTAMFPRPHNSDTENVWLWVRNYSLRSERGKGDWKTMIQTSHEGCFVVFTNGRLATGVCTLGEGGDPWSGLESNSKMSKEEAQQILGKRP